MTTHLIVDTSAMAYRAMYSTGTLEHEGEATGVLYGIFRDVSALAELHQTQSVAWCFDGGYDGRKNLFPGYKASRHKRHWADEQLRESRRQIRKQLYRLRTKLLPEAGFANVFWQEGYEADDLIASTCKGMPDGDIGITVAADSDFYQLLEVDRVLIWNPMKKKIITAESFTAEWGLPPEDWAMVKAIAGCSSDEVPGVKGVGEKTVAKYLRGELGEQTKAFKAIVASGDIIERNLQLVRLPFAGTMPCPLRCDNRNGWNRVMKSLGINSLLGRMK